MVLGYSRLQWVRFLPRQRMRTLMRGLEAAFAAFGGEPAELFFDQLEAMILQDPRPDGGRVLENPEFLCFAAYWDFGFGPVAPTARRPKTKWSDR